MACQINLSPFGKNRYSRSFPCSVKQCKTCGWNEEEHERRISRGLVTGSDGLRHFIATPAKNTGGDTV